MTVANTTGVIGQSNDGATSVAMFPLGLTVLIGNTDYVYAQAAAAQAAAATFGLTGAFATTTGSAYTHDLPAPGVLINNFFWAKKVASPF